MSPPIPNSAVDNRQSAIGLGVIWVIWQRNTSKVRRLPHCPVTIAIAMKVTVTVMVVPVIVIVTPPSEPKNLCVLRWAIANEAVANARSSFRPLSNFFGRCKHVSKLYVIKCYEFVICAPCFRGFLGSQAVSQLFGIRMWGT